MSISTKIQDLNNEIKKNIPTGSPSLVEVKIGLNAMRALLSEISYTGTIYNLADEGVILGGIKITAHIPEVKKTKKVAPYTYLHKFDGHEVWKNSNNYYETDKEAIFCFGETAKRITALEIEVPA